MAIVGNLDRIAMARVFISYRREDSIAYAGRLYDLLEAHFGEEQVFMDIDTLKPGEDFVDALQNTVASCDVLIAVIGKRWLSGNDKRGPRRIDSDEDFVRLEIAAALDRNIRVIPVLVGGAEMPDSSNLPDALKKLARRHAFNLPDIGFRQLASSLINSLEEIIAAHRQEINITGQLRFPNAALRTEETLAAAQQDAEEPIVPAGQAQYELGDPEQTQSHAAQVKQGQNLASANRLDTDSGTAEKEAALPTKGQVRSAKPGAEGAKRVIVQPIKSVADTSAFGEAGLESGNPEHVSIIKRGSDEWNRWRKQEPIGVIGQEPDLRGVILCQAKLWGTNFRSVDLRGANLSGANLNGAILAWANLGGTDPSKTDLRQADLRGANLSRPI